MSHVFVSYVRENALDVERLRDDLALAGIDVWLDRDSLEPGSLWKEAIRKAIQTGAFFLACFSQQWNEREKTYMNEELILAIEEIRQRPFHRSWFIPIKLTPCDVPDRDLGGGLRLHDFQWLALYTDWKSGVRRLLNVIEPLPTQLAELVSKLGSQKEKYSAAAGILNEMEHWPEEKRTRPLPFLLDHLYDPDASFTYYVVQALGLVRHERGLEALERALDDAEWRGHRYKLAEVVEAIDPYNGVARAYRERERDSSKFYEWLEQKKGERGA
jgi:TIR domain